MAMSNKQVIAIFILGIALLLVAFWAGLNIIKQDSSASINQANTVAAKPQIEYPSAHTQNPSGEDTLYRIYIGPYTKRQDAQQVANELTSSGYKNVMIFPWKQN